MRSRSWGKWILCGCALAPMALSQPTSVCGQSGYDKTAVALSAGAPQKDLAGVTSLLRQLQAQVQELSGQVKSLQTQQEVTAAESARLRKELDAAKTQLVALSTTPVGTVPSANVGSEPRPQSSTDERITRLEENQQLADEKTAEQSQTKVESASKYRLWLSGIVLFNMYANRGAVDNQDFPQIATTPSLLSSGGTFGGSLRQSQIGIEGFGPPIAGARTSAQVQFDFAGGFPQTENGVSFGIMRLRTGTVRFDWDKTSIIAGQDALFISPASPTSIATLATPAFSYSGNLWGWIPQVRVEHRFTVSDNSSLLVQGGILDSLTGDTPTEYYRYPTWGESSGQPAYAARIAWTQNLHGQNLILGIGGYYSRQDWGFARPVDGWAGTLDATVPLGNRFEFTGQFYRGKAIGGIGGGIGQSVLWNGSLADPDTEVYGLNSIGGWVQLKYKATSKLHFNGAFGQDNPFAADLRQFGGNQTYYPSPLSKNRSTMVNFLYQPKSDIVLSMEYKRLTTYTLDSNVNAANIFNMSVGYIF